MGRALGRDVKGLSRFLAFPADLLHYLDGTFANPFSSLGNLLSSLARLTADPFGGLADFLSGLYGASRSYFGYGFACLSGFLSSLGNCLARNFTSFGDSSATVLNSVFCFADSA